MCYCNIMFNLHIISAIRFRSNAYFWHDVIETYSKPGTTFGPLLR